MTNIEIKMVRQRPLSKYPNDVYTRVEKMDTAR